MDSAHFRNQPEMDEAFKFMTEQARTNGKAWFKANANHVLYQWEAHKDNYRQELVRQAKRKKREKKRKGLLKRLLGL